MDRGQEAALRRGDLAGAAHLELVSGVAQLHPEDAMFEAMLRGWRAQQTARGLQEGTIAPRERLVRRFISFTNEYPWRWGPAHVDEWSLSMTGELQLAPSTIRGYQTDLRLFSEYLCDGRYGWIAACQREFGPQVHPVAIVHEWNTIAHLNSYEGRPEARPFTREVDPSSRSILRETSSWSESLKAVGAVRSSFSIVSITSAALRAGRAPDPEKITSSMPVARMFL